jgi:hypothetical protein
LEWLRGDIDFGFGAIYLNHIGVNLASFIDVCGEKILPEIQ